MNETVLLTGATGFVGMEVLSRLLEQPDTEVVALVRAEDRRAAAARMRSVLDLLLDDGEEAARRVTAVPGDVAVDGLGLGGWDRFEILERVTSVVHCAASIAFDDPLLQAVNINAAGADRVAGLVGPIARRGRLRRFVHVSTAYVAGCHVGRFAESDLDVGQTFRNTYEHSKFHAERELRDGHDLPLTIVRPSIVVGDSRTGWTPTFNVIYWPLRAFAQGRLDDVPADPEGLVDVVPVDYVADGVVGALRAPDAWPTLHIVAGDHAPTTVEIATLAAEHFGRPAPRLGAAGVGEGDLREGAVYLPYFDVRTRFEDGDTRALLGEGVPAPPPLARYFATIIGYAQAADWGRTTVTRAAAARGERPAATVTVS